MKPQPIRFRNRAADTVSHHGNTFRLTSLTLAFLALSGAVTFADPSWYDGTNQKGVQPGTPDFYQHQTTTNAETKVNAGFCWQSAFEDAMYFLHNNGFGNLYIDSANWVDAMNGNLAQIVGTPGGGDTWMNTYINNKGYASVLSENTIANPGGGFSVFNSFTNNLLAGSNVLIHIDANSVTGLWWSASYHVVDAVGFDAPNHKIIVADPDNNKYGGFGFPGDSTPNNKVDYLSSEPVPIENGFADVGANVTVVTNSLLQSYTVDANGVLTDGPYAGTKIDFLFAIGPIPEPSSVVLALVALTTFAACRRSRRK